MPSTHYLQALLQPMIVDVVQRAFHELPPPSITAVNTACSSSTYVQPSRSSQALSLLGESLSFPSFISTVCFATGTLSSPLVSAFVSSAASSTLTTPVVLAPVLSFPPSLFTTGLFASPVLLPPPTLPSCARCPGFDIGPGRLPILPKLVNQRPTLQSQLSLCCHLPLFALLLLLPLMHGARLVPANYLPSIAPCSAVSCPSFLSLPYSSPFFQSAVIVLPLLVTTLPASSSPPPCLVSSTSLFPPIPVPLEPLLPSPGAICDLSRENVPNGSRSNAERNSKRTDDERHASPFERLMNGW